MREGAARRRAVMMAAQLPEERADALAVLDHLRTLVDGYWAPAQPRRAALVALEGGAAPSGSSPSAAARSRGSLEGSPS